MESASQNQQWQQPTQTTSTRTLFNGLNTLTGIGMVSISYALSQGGWISLVMFLVIASICFYTALLLQQCMDANPTIKTYPDIGAHAFGRKGRVVISIFIYLELFLIAVEFLILEGDNLHNLFPNVCLRIFGRMIGGKKVFIMMTALVVLPTTWLNDLSLLAYVSASGISASIILLGIVLWIGVFEGVGFSGNGVLCSNYSGMLTTVSVYTFCFSGHPVFPTLYTSMRNKDQFRKVLFICFSLSAVSYGSMAVIGYLMYGENLVSQITLNLPKRNISSEVAIYITLIIPIAKYAIILSPIIAALEKTAIPQDKNMGLIRLAIRTSLVVCTCIVALVVPFFGYVMAFIGALLCSCASFLFPCICYVKIHKAYRRFGVELIFIAAIVLLGVFVAVTGTFTSVRDIVKHA
ncbi:hypothetical protein ABFX02_12G104600 [Erythranthe guttata]